jgi:formylmethanofuran dehydrogenase subunit E
MKIGTYSYEEYVQAVKSFHGTLAPGLLLGGFMVDLALKNVPEGDFLIQTANRDMYSGCCAASYSMH